MLHFYLTAFRKYKILIAAVLLAFYAFLATPVQLWHSHNYAVNTQKSDSTNDKKQITFSKSTDKSIESNCQICTHHFSTYYDDATTIFSATLIIALISQGNLYTKIPLDPIFYQANKGPPTLI